MWADKIGAGCSLVRGAELCEDAGAGEPAAWCGGHPAYPADRGLVRGKGGPPEQGRNAVEQAAEARRRGSQW